ncbi:ABC transporter permease [Gordonia sp. HY002]|uniref:ABC transporter permease n=1 Tax=Gordonia zhenghanii TaxID=2911516 RepID=UPI001EEFC6B1|nr:ABC transporter permease [Gordonia zhenghanii]MCF8572091.1 ABC transporter permease [Gordonia zhenghanii]MCF8602965.1 ABC transporter permease [Gordonia zhenghanii]
MTVTDAPLGHRRVADAIRRSAPSPRRSLLRWLAKLVAALVVLFVAASITFLLQTFAPGDRATLLLNLAEGTAKERTADELAPVNAAYGFGDSVWQQYLHYIGGLLRGDLGTSYQLQQPVTEVIAEQVTPTLVLTFSSLIVAWLLVLFLTTLTAGRRGPWGALGSLIETISAGLPQYWVGSILMVVFAIGLGWFPVESGTGVHGLILPVLTLAIPLAGFLGQTTRDEFARALDEPFVLTARSRGLSDIAVRARHVLRHSVLPAVTVSGWAMGALLSGAVIAETVFARAGIGQTLVAAASSRDIPLVSGIVIFVAVVYTIANLAVDALYTLIDPRIEVP